MVGTKVGRPRRLQGVHTNRSQWRSENRSHDRYQHRSVELFLRAGHMDCAWRKARGSTTGRLFDSTRALLVTRHVLAGRTAIPIDHGLRTSQRRGNQPTQAEPHQNAACKGTPHASSVVGQDSGEKNVVKMAVTVNTAKMSAYSAATAR